MTAMPAAWAAAGPLSTARWPSMSSSPSSGWWTPASIFTTVDLPAPFSPTRACASPPQRSIEASTTARTAPNAFAACTSETSAGSGAGEPGAPDGLDGPGGVDGPGGPGLAGRDEPGGRASPVAGLGEPGGPVSLLAEPGEP